MISLLVGTGQSSTVPESLGTKQLSINPSKDDGVSRENGSLPLKRSLAAARLSKVLRRFLAACALRAAALSFP